MNRMPRQQKKQASDKKEEQIQAAIAAVRKGQSVNSAAKEFGVWRNLETKETTETSKSGIKVYW